MRTILRAQNISKQYRLGLVGTGSLKHDLNRWWHKIKGKEDPYLKMGAMNYRDKKSLEDYVWALKDINFEVKEGEVLGLIGQNGAGKSTLLKILSRVTSPTTGTIKTRGRIASLLEVGTGFHGELTGRENIYMNGAVLGMTKAEIKRKLDEIIDFSGCEMYIDTPIKRYSSGMTVRLGFAVAAHLEPEILVVDEVLAVGDAEFQKKAIGKMQDLSTGEGRTVLFVSHNMASVKSLCTRSILLEHGEAVFEGGVEDTIDRYLQVNETASGFNNIKRIGNGLVQVEKIEIVDSNGNILQNGYSGQNIKVLLHYRSKLKNSKNINLNPSIAFVNSTGVQVFNHHSRLNGIRYNNLPAKGIFSMTINNLPLPASTYNITYSLMSHHEYLDFAENVHSFRVIEGDFYGSGEIPPSNHTLFLLEAQWDLIPENKEYSQK